MYIHLSLYFAYAGYMRLPYMFLFLLLCLPALAQEYRGTVKAPNAFYLEISGNSDTYSLNYDRILYQRHIYKLTARAGVGTNLFFQEGEPGVYPVVPLEAMVLFGRNIKHLELGLGYTRRFTTDEDLLQNLYFARLGFRYQQPRGGLVVRLGFTPFLSPETQTSGPGTALVPRFGLSVGRSF